MFGDSPQGIQEAVVVRDGWKTPEREPAGSAKFRQQVVRVQFKFGHSVYVVRL